MKLELDEEFILIAKNIIHDEEYLKLKECIHHGVNRYDHSIKVAYEAYKYAKKKNLDYKTIAIGGLLHDYFFNEENHNIKKRVVSTFTHPKKALKNVKSKYDVNDVIHDIVETHMFPINLKIPKYKESWIVSFFDKKVAIGEFYKTTNHKMKLSLNFLILLLFNLI